MASNRMGESVVSGVIGVVFGLIGGFVMLSMKGDEPIASGELYTALAIAGFLGSFFANFFSAGRKG